MFEIVIFALGAVTGAAVLFAVSRGAVAQPEVPRSAIEGSGRAERPDGPEVALVPASTPLPETEPLMEDAARRWQPPYIAGDELFAWARSVSRGVVRDVVRDGPDADTASEVTKGVGRGLARAMLPDTRADVRGRAVPCPSAGQGVLAVTAPEAIALADQLRERLTSTELEALQADVTFYEELITNGASAAPCAVQGEDHVCMAYGARPFSCRPTLAMTLAQQLRAETDQPPTARSFEDVHGDTVAKGVKEGLRVGLERAGLDAKSYELHSALRRALARPDAAEAWARGEDVFAKCRIVGQAG